MVTPLIRGNKPPSYAGGYARGPYKSAQPEDWVGLIGSWIPALGHTGNTLFDVSGRRNSGLLTAMVPADDWIIDPNMGGFVLDYDGGDDQVEIPHLSDLNLSSPTTDGTIIMIFSKPSWVSNDGLLGKYSSAERNWIVWTNISTDNLTFSRHSGSGLRSDVTVTNAALYDGTPTFVASVSRGTDIEIYAGKLGSGVLTKTVGGFSTTWSDNSNTGVVVIGNYRQDASRNIAAKIGQIDVYNRALSDAQLEQIFNSPLGKLQLVPRRVGIVSGGGVLVTPPTASLTLTGFAPTVSTPVVVTPPTAALTLTGLAPTVSTPVVVTTPTASLAVTGFAPTVTVAINQIITPPTVVLTLTTFAPTVTISDNQVVTPPTASLILTGFAPTVVVTLNQLVTPPTAVLTLTGFAPSILIPIIIIPGVAMLVLSAFAPTITVQSATPFVTLDAQTRSQSADAASRSTTLDMQGRT